MNPLSRNPGSAPEDLSHLKFQQGAYLISEEAFIRNTTVSGTCTGNSQVDQEPGALHTSKDKMATLHNKSVLKSR